MRQKRIGREGERPLDKEGDKNLPTRVALDIRRTPMIGTECHPVQVGLFLLAVGVASNWRLNGNSRGY